MTAKYDEGKAALRELIRRSGEDEIADYMAGVMEKMNSDDPSESLLHTAAVVGLIGAWLSLRLESVADEMMEGD